MRDEITSHFTHVIHASRVSYITESLPHKLVVLERLQRGTEWEFPCLGSTSKQLISQSDRLLALKASTPRLVVDDPQGIKRGTAQPIRLPDG